MRNTDPQSHRRKLAPYNTFEAISAYVGGREQGTERPANGIEAIANACGIKVGSCPDKCTPPEKVESMRPKITEGHPWSSPTIAMASDRRVYHCPVHGMCD